ncbi:hypothetical protein SPN40_03815 [Morganella morganii]|uniref:hypothetical protein n=1 Tax=Morganella morganii TaxID=582 RepID=UPI002AA6FC51|nr:hypothetical protein [Morganella morganii]WPU19517.1 hypothetical protein SPN40_03815 [Morganella morganii]
MNRDKNLSIIDLIKKYKSTILFWIIVLLLTPFILFSIFFNFNDLNTVSNLGQFGAFLSGITGLLTTIMTIISISVLFYTLLVTKKYNEQQIEMNNNQIKISNTNLLIDLALSSINETKEKYSIHHADNEWPTNKFITEIYSSYENYHRSIGTDTTISSFNKELGFLFHEEKVLSSEYDPIEIIFDVVGKSGFRFYIEPYTPIIYGIIKMIYDENNSSDLRNILYLLLKNKISNDFIFWSIIFESSTLDESKYYLSNFCCSPNSVLKAFNEVKKDDL